MSFFRKPTPLPVYQGGTGDVYFDYGYAVIGNGYSALLELSPSSSGNVMTSNGVTWTSAPPSGGTVYPAAGIANSTGSAWGSSYSTTGANSVVVRDANQNISVNAISTGFTNVAAAGTTTTLTALSTPNFVVTGSGGQTYQLPDATTLPNGAIFTFNNNQSSGTIVVKNNSSTTVVTVQSGGFVVVVLLSNSIAAGTWDYHFQAPSNVSWSTNTFNYVGSITGATWNGTAIGTLYGGTGLTSFTSGGVVYASSTSSLTTGSALTITTIGTSVFTVNRTSSTNATSITLRDTVTGAQTNGVYKSIRSESNAGSSVSEIRFLESDGTNNNTAIAFATANSAGNLSEKARILNTGAILAFAGANTLATGTGVSFPATQNASSDANTLDDYEKGTWTPNQGSGLTITGGFGSDGRYIKIGNSVYVYGYVYASSTLSLAANGVICSNLPFTANGGVVAFGDGRQSAGNLYSGSSGVQQPCNASANTSLNNSQTVIASANYPMWFAITYITS